MQEYCSHGEQELIKCHLSKLMGERKLNIADLARELGVHRNTITLLYYEKAKRIDFDVLDKLCKYFNCTISDLLEFKR
jgi:putative transcriptional regulator